MAAHKGFATFADAFEYCRDMDQPVTVLIVNEKWKLYPSGGGKLIRVLDSHVEDSARTSDLGAQHEPG